MHDDIPVVVWTRIECAKYGHTEDDTYEFDMPLAKARPRGEYVPGSCQKCSAPVQMYLIRTQQMQ